jgi:hypothetical protein
VPRLTLSVLVLQVGAALAAMAPVYFLAPVIGKQRPDLKPTLTNARSGSATSPSRKRAEHCVPCAQAKRQSP